LKVSEENGKICVRNLTVRIRESGCRSGTQLIL